MLGKDLYKIDVNGELSNERLKSLVFFYEPLIGSGALHLYEYLFLRGSTIGFDELNNLLMSLNSSIDKFEKRTVKLNEYRLLKTLNKDNRYIFVLNEPLSRLDFIHDNILVRDFILKTSGPYYQDLISDIYSENTYQDFDDVSATLSIDTLNKWSKNEESYLKTEQKDNYRFNTLFNINTFLKNISTNLLPMSFRSKENMYQIALLGDLYNVSYDQMQQFLPKVFDTKNNTFNLNKLKYLCMNVHSSYKKYDDSQFNISPVLYLMSLQDGKEVSDYDKKIIYNLANAYNLKTDVINVLLRHCLNTCDNRLLENYLYPIASDFHRNDVDTADKALQRLNKAVKGKNITDTMPTYDSSNNQQLSQMQQEQLLKLMGKDE